MEKKLSIQQAVVVTELSAHTLRYYERIGLLQPGRDRSSGYRAYSEQDMNLIAFIKRLRATGMPMREIVRYTDLMRQGETTVAARLALLEQHRQRVEEAQREVNRHLEAINAKIAYYQSRDAHSLDPCLPPTPSSEEEKSKYLEQNVQATEVVLNADDLKRINALAQPTGARYDPAGMRVLNA